MFVVLFIYLPAINCRDPATLADPVCTTYVIQHAAVAVTATNKLSALPVPTNTVLACHHGLGISQNLKE